ncbi:hypothetical protein DFH94DRAFT_685451 [Russula ochroleuca]|uniref:Uncharacterized protein n=1 Tax=Russula ochroleuca TaxID=152965 RepID=A0A9P5JYK5_9AGAM|nr:hypothetical protein DFH94DRAFT_685451 [Russula ochroleuca]
MPRKTHHAGAPIRELQPSTTVTSRRTMTSVPSYVYVRKHNPTIIYDLVASVGGYVFLVMVIISLSEKVTTNGCNAVGLRKMPVGKCAPLIKTNALHRRPSEPGGGRQEEANKP